MIENACATWETAALVEAVDVEVPCRSGVLLAAAAAAQDRVRFAFVSVGSPLEEVTGSNGSILDRSGSPLALVDLAGRLLDGEVAAVLAPHGSVAPASSAPTLPDALLARRQEIRRSNVLARFLLRQIGLEEVSTHRGAPAKLYTDLAALWSLDLALCTDPAMLLTLGADRQRYVDEHYNERATDRLPRALGRLHDLGVRSYPRLVIV